MLAYILRRLAISSVVIVGVSIAVFLMLHLIPGDPAIVMLSENPSTQDVAALRASLGLDQPLPVQYWRYISHALQGDLGRSLRLQRPVVALIADRFPNTLLLTATSLGLAAVVGGALGIIAAANRGRLLNLATMLLALTGVCLPSFWLGLMLIMFFSLRLDWLPVAGNQDGLKSVILPVLTLAAVPLAIIARLTRSSLLEVLGEDFIRTARAKGLRERTVVLRHALNNSLIPLITVLGIQFGSLLSGAVIVETVFVWPGLGRLIIDAVQARDFPVVQGVTLVVSCCFIVLNLLVDVLYAYIDPRIRYS